MRREIDWRALGRQRCRYFEPIVGRAHAAGKQDGNDGEQRKKLAWYIRFHKWQVDNFGGRNIVPGLDRMAHWAITDRRCSPLSAWQVSEAQLLQ